MKVLLISGENDSGKSTLIYAIATWLEQRGYQPDNVNEKGFWKFERISEDDQTSNKNSRDIQTFFEKNGVRVYVHSATDDEDRINELVENVEKIKEEKIDVLITSVRNYGDNMRNLLCENMKWKESGYQLHDKNDNLIREIPLVKIKYFSATDKSNMIEWYESNLLPVVETYIKTYYGL